MLVLAVSAGGLIPKSAYAAPGDLFASVNGNHQNGGGSIFQYAPDGTKSTFGPPLDRPRGLAFDSASNLFVATTTLDNSGNFQGTIFKITPDGLMSTFATGFGNNFFVLSLVMDSAGNIFVVAANQNDPNLASTIYKVTPDGTVSKFASIPGLGIGLAFDSAGNLFAANSSQTFNSADQTNQAIYMFTFNPAGVSLFAGTSAFPSGEGPSALAFDSFGNLFVSAVDNNCNGVILEFAKGFAPGGTPTTFTTALTPNGNARGLAFDASGNLFLADPMCFGPNTTGDILEFMPGAPPTKTVFASGIGIPTGNGGPEYLAFPPNTLASPSGSPVPVNIGTVGSAVIALTFPQVTGGGTTTVAPIDPSSAGTLPPGFQLTGTKLAFQITTTATYTTPVIIAFQMQPSVDPLTFSQLRVLHNEGGTLVDRTATNPAPDPVTQTIYASVSSLSPFVIAKDTVTFDSLIALTRRSVTNSRVMYDLVAALTIAKNADARGFPKIEDLALKVYIKLVSLVSGKFITPQNAAILVSEARTL